MPTLSDLSDSSSSYESDDSSSFVSTDSENGLLSSSSSSSSEDEHIDIKPKSSSSKKSSNSNSKSKKTQKGEITNYFEPKQKKEKQKQPKKEKTSVDNSTKKTSEPKKKKTAPKPPTETLFQKASRESSENNVKITDAELLELTKEPIKEKEPEPKIEEKKIRKKKITCMTCGKSDDHMTKTCPLKQKNSLSVKETLNIQEMDILSDLLLKSRELDQKETELNDQKKKYQAELEHAEEELKGIKKMKMEYQTKISSAYQNLGSSILENAGNKQENSVSDIKEQEEEENGEQ